ncbi:MAG: putative membrane protein [Phormidesmis priestleyi Ana]|uniref:GDT1 family protein n=1 Tax=Phormidesmis priestleyi Ana TaxID=1666911 RepID=A0A0P7ZS42_9CYAN|nr:MAG: putative membrane protein [Phormidesmis priestleyi Ana]
MIAPEPIIQEPSIADSATHRPPENIPEAKSEDNIVANAAVPNNAGAFWVVFLSTFITIFLAELGDKTQLATLLLSAESQSPLVVFFGAGLALVATSLIGVLLGQWLSKRIPEETLDTCAGILLLLITIGLVGDIVGH